MEGTRSTAEAEPNVVLEAVQRGSELHVSLALKARPKDVNRCGDLARLFGRGC